MTRNIEEGKYYWIEWEDAYMPVLVRKVFAEGAAIRSRLQSGAIGIQTPSGDQFVYPEINIIDIPGAEAAFAIWKVTGSGSLIPD